MADNQPTAKAPTPPAQPPVQPVAKAVPGEDVTYIPGPQDPASIRWRGILFQANVPIRIADDGHIDAARGNKFFRVGTGDKATQAEEPKPEPTTPEAYRAWVIGWLDQVKTVDELLTKWSNDRYIRQNAQAGTLDIRQLGTIIDPRLNLMAKEQGLSDQQVGKLMLQHGLAEIPWRV